LKHVLLLLLLLQGAYNGFVVVRVPRLQQDNGIPQQLLRDRTQQIRRRCASTSFEVVAILVLWGGEALVLQPLLNAAALAGRCDQRYAKTLQRM
jgi:hypothetical protein